MNIINNPTHCAKCHMWDCHCSKRPSMEESKLRQEQYDKYLYMMNYVYPDLCDLKIIRDDTKCVRMLWVKAVDNMPGR